MPTERRRRWRPYQVGFAVVYCLLFAGILFFKIPQALNSPQQQASSSSVSPWTIFGHVCAGPKIYVPDTDAIFVLRAKDGSKCWETDYFSEIPPVYANGVIYTDAYPDQRDVQMNTGPVIAVHASDDKLLWSNALPILPSHIVVAADSDTVYVTTQAPAHSDILSNSNGIYALNASNGAVRWHYPFVPPALEMSLPLIVGSTLYVGVGESLVALNAETGELLWTQPLQFKGNDYAALAMTSANGVLYITASGYSTGNMIIQGDIHLFALRANNGKLLWNVTTNAVDLFYYDADPSTLAPVVANGVVYMSTLIGVGGTDGARLYAMRASDGKPLWRYDILNRPQPSNGVIDDSAQAVMFSQPIVADGMLYTSNLNEVLALSAATGKVIWQQPAAIADQPAGLALANGTLIVHTGDTTYPGLADTVLAFSASNGTQLWHRTFDETSAGYVPLFLT
jgi:outer membrane protein assembly factor BamB